MTIQNPPVFEHGFVVGRYVTAVADTLSDEDRYPDLRPITGRVRFTPLQSVHLKGGEYPATVVKQPITVDLNEQGYVEDVESRNDLNRPAGVYLAVGLYRVEPVFENVSSISRFTIQVTAGHTKEAPLDLTLAAPIETPPGFTEVVRIVDRVRAEDAADAAEGHAATALVYRDEAAQSAATAEAHSTSAVESAEAAEGHADRAEQARDETVSNAIEVDTSAGTKVTVGGHVVHYDSGWRDISSMLQPGLTVRSGGVCQIRRVGNVVHWVFSISVSDGESVASLFDGIPASFLPTQYTYPPPGYLSRDKESAAPASRLRFGDDRTWLIAPTTAGNQQGWCTGTATPFEGPETIQWAGSILVDRSYPSTLPGTPA